LSSFGVIQAFAGQFSAQRISMKFAPNRASGIADTAMALLICLSTALRLAAEEQCHEKNPQRSRAS
jgi:hypothetical protein